MYRRTEPPIAEFDAGGLLPPEKRERCQKSWAGAFRKQALPILLSVEDQFADLFQDGMGRPNRSVALLLGVHVLKEMNDLTDQETLDAMEFDTRWWWAFQMDPREMHLSEKTLYNFRRRLMEKDKSKLAFRTVTDRLVQVLGVDVGQQRLDSTHIISNFASLTRLGLFCETIRVFLAEVRKLDESLYQGIPEGVRGRHAKGTYHDARSAEGATRLKVVARDVWKLVRLFQDDERVTKTEGWKLLHRLFEEQCRVGRDVKGPGPGDPDLGEGRAPAEPKAPKEVGSDSLQTPHDPDVTYSGHKGKGYEVQVVETCGEGSAVRLITDVEVTDSCGSDANATVPMVDALVEAGLKPKELVADTGYSGAENAAALADREVNLLAPTPAAGKPDPEVAYPPPEANCPKDEKEALEWLRRQEASPSFHKRYSIRAGIEGTGSELKRAHGLGKLRVRRKPRVRLAVYFKALACNIKRAIQWWLRPGSLPEGAVSPG